MQRRAGTPPLSTMAALPFCWLLHLLKRDRRESPHPVINHHGDMLLSACLLCTLQVQAPAETGYHTR